jgi:hypothetical protein
MYSPWGQKRPLRKCLILSIGAHVLLIGFATTVEVVVPVLPRWDLTEPIPLSLVESDEASAGKVSLLGGEFGDFAALPASEGNGKVHFQLPVGGDNESFVTVPPIEAPEELFESFPGESRPETTAALSEEVRPEIGGEPAPEFSESTLSAAVADEVAELPVSSEPTPIEGAEQATAALPRNSTPPTWIPVVSSAEKELPHSSAPVTGLLAAGEELGTEISRPHTDWPQVDKALVEVAQPTVAAGPEEDHPLPGSDLPSEQILEDAPLRDLTLQSEEQEKEVPLPGLADNSVRLTPTFTRADPVRESADVTSWSEPARPTLMPKIPLAAPSPEPEIQTPVWRTPPRAENWQVPEIYRLRVAPNRRLVAQARGATPATDLAVEKGLAWLARNQEADGRWNPRRHQAGIERFVAGRDRQAAGKDADTGITGLALLAFMGAGYTHLDGPYQTQIRRGLEFLIRGQKADGNLAGEAGYFSGMYCHAMALLALAEAYALTGSPEFREPIAKGVVFTLQAQDPVEGGWRYRPRDPGDTSILGWQILALKSAEFAGLLVPQQTFDRARRFVESVSSGKAGGLAAYRAVERPSPAMTAEALVCRLFLGTAPTDPVVQEAVEFILAEPPGKGPPNFYYWYYATFGLSQVGGEAWERWNQALRYTLVSSQRRDYPWDGSWDPTCIWGGYGGRVYTTALAILCLEAYYRYLPLLQLSGAGQIVADGQPVSEPASWVSSAEVARLPKN